MKWFVLLTVAAAGLAGTGGGVFANPTGPHADNFTCNRCHTSTPAEGAATEDANLVKPIQELCAECH